MEPMGRRGRLAVAAHHYYIDGWSQDKIAQQLGTGRSNVSRMLEAARQEGVVRFVIDHPLQRHEVLERELEDRFGISEAIVLAALGDTLDSVGRLAAHWVVDHLGDGGRIAIGWGRSVEATVRHVAVSKPLDVEVGQVGGDLTMAPAPSGHELVRRLAEGLGGRYRFLHAPALVEDEKVAEELLSDPRIREELNRAKTASIALIGIGVPGEGFAERAIADSYRGTKKPASVVCARLIDVDGNEVDGPLGSRVIALTLEEVRTIPSVLGVAVGAAKGEAVAAALSGGLVDVLVCDQSVAAAALDVDTARKRGESW
jgi:DNA-binding transcriptional regulator LsrR (DeoR family)